MPSLRGTSIAAVVSVAAFAGTTVVAQAMGLPEGPGKQELLASCTQCHGIDVVTAQRRSPEEWLDVVSRMVGNGATLTDDQYKIVVAYLSKNLNQAPGPAAGSGNARCSSKSTAATPC